MSALCSFAFGVLFILGSVHTGKFSVRVVEVWILRLELRISIQLAPCCQVSNYGAESWSIFPVSFARERYGFRNRTVRHRVCGLSPRAESLGMLVLLSMLGSARQGRFPTSH